MIQKVINRFRLAEQGVQGKSILVLGLIVCLLSGVIHDWLWSMSLQDKEEVPMKTKMKNAILICSKSILYTIWTMSTNFSIETALQP